MVDLESAVEALYAGSPDDFIERRKALVGEARAAKDRALATAIGALRRPTRSAWLVNLYARQAPDELAKLLDLGEALQTAQRKLSGPDLRRLSADRSKALAAAARRAVDLGHDHGYDAPEAARLEVSQTLQAALADPEVAAQVRAGTVTQAQAYGGFGPFALVAPTPVPEQAEPEQAAPERAEDEQAEARRVEAGGRLEAAEAALSTAAEEAETATTRADELADRVEVLRAEIAEA
ncbi:MAG TPA: hypothetical protein VFR88_13915, partial [Microlunatus sp.]|nr:hypothetical protein [Microlunatus sp.]